MGCSWIYFGQLLDVHNLIAPNAAEVTPVTFDASTPVVVAAIRGSASAGEIFGKTKITLVTLGIVSLVSVVPLAVAAFHVQESIPH